MKRRTLLLQSAGLLAASATACDAQTGKRSDTNSTPDRAQTVHPDQYVPVTLYSTEIMEDAQQGAITVEGADIFVSGQVYPAILDCMPESTPGMKDNRFLGTADAGDPFATTFVGEGSIYATIYFTLRNVTSAPINVQVKLTDSYLGQTYSPSTDPIYLEY